MQTAWSIRGALRLLQRAVPSWAFIGFQAALLRKGLACQARMPTPTQRLSPSADFCYYLQHPLSTPPPHPRSPEFDSDLSQYTYSLPPPPHWFISHKISWKLNLLPLRTHHRSPISVSAPSKLTTSCYVVLRVRHISAERSRSSGNGSWLFPGNRSFRWIV